MAANCPLMNTNFGSDFRAALSLFDQVLDRHIDPLRQVLSDRAASAADSLADASGVLHANSINKPMAFIQIIHHWEIDFFAPASDANKTSSNIGTFVGYDVTYDIFILNLRHKRHHIQCQYGQCPNSCGLLIRTFVRFAHIFRSFYLFDCPVRTRAFESRGSRGTPRRVPPSQAFPAVYGKACDGLSSQPPLRKHRR